MKVLRTIAIVDAVAVAVFGAVGWLFGLSPMQTLGAGIIGLSSIILVLGWRAIVNAPGRRQDERTQLGCDPVDRLPPERAVAELVEPARRVRVEPYPWPQLEAPRRELERKA